MRPWLPIHVQAIHCDSKWQQRGPLTLSERSHGTLREWANCCSDAKYHAAATRPAKRLCFCRKLLQKTSRSPIAGIKAFLLQKCTLNHVIVHKELQTVSTGRNLPMKRMLCILNQQNITVKGQHIYTKDSDCMNICDIMQDSNNVINSYLNGPTWWWRKAIKTLTYPTSGR